MASLHSFYLLLLICASILVVGSSSEDHHHLSWIPTAAAAAAAKSACKGSIAECALAAGNDEVEFDMDSEISRRILATSNYISYGALQRNTVPCSRRGASYYNCQPGAQSNPYSRGCSAITRCRS